MTIISLDPCEHYSLTYTHTTKTKNFFDNFSSATTEIMGNHSKKRKQKDRDLPHLVSSFNIESLEGQSLSDRHYITLDGKRVAKLVEGDVDQCKLLALDKFGCFMLAGHRVGIVQLLAPKPEVDVSAHHILLCQSL
jgi:hypothetical protein